MKSKLMPIAHCLLALLVVAIWGVNFLFVSIALEEIPPLFLCAIRFVLTSLPAVFFFKLPRESYKMVAIYGLVMFASQFSLLFLGMSAGMPPGMASLIMQVQVFFSMFFAAIMLDEKPFSWQIVGALISFSGIAIVAMHFDKTVTFLGFVFILAAAATWGFGNLLTKKLTHVKTIPLVIWGSFFACFPMLLLSFFFEGMDVIPATYQRLTWHGVGAVFYIVGASTWIAYVSWTWLVSRYPVGIVVPFTLLVPIVGILCSVIFFGEPLQFWKLLAGLLVIGGLCINLLGSRLFLARQLNRM
jgi:O-acetylserine/cysteine efflux transporter